MDAVSSFFLDLAHTWLGYVKDVLDLRALWQQFVRPAGTTATFYWQNVLIYVLVGLVVCAWQLRGRGLTLGAALRGLVPPDLGSPAVKVDLQFFLYDVLGIRRVALVTLSMLLCIPVATRFVRGLELWKLPGLSLASAWATALPPLPRTGLGFLLSALGAEFAFYWYHRAAHKSPLLWQFHKVHHYSREMNPLVAIRTHDLDEVFQIQALFLGGLFALGLLFPIDGDTSAFQRSEFWAVVLYQALMQITGRFSHSHIPLSFGPVLNRVLNTAVVHQMHHSREIFDTNFGQSLSIWDTVFGTLRLPEPGEEIRFGITEFGDEHYRGLVHCQLEPYREAWRILRGRKQAGAGALAAPPPG